MQLGFGLYAWSTGASRRIIKILNQCNLSPSYTTILEVVDRIGKQCVIEATEAVNSSPHALGYDNFQTSRSNHVEQRPNAPNKVECGTFPMIYQLYNAHFEDMLLEPMLKRFRSAKPLSFGDITSTPDQISSYTRQSRIHVIRVLIKHCSGFAPLALHSDLQHKARRPLPHDHRTQFFPLHMVPIEEASIKGNLLVQNDVYKIQLNQKTEPDSKIVKYAVPLFADLMTILRARQCVAQRKGDINHFETRESIGSGEAAGVFHMGMNLDWVVKNKHAGSELQVGSLKYWFSKLDKVRLGGDKPDYHALLATFEQILDGMLLHAWLLECGYSSLDAFANSKPTPEELLKIADHILLEYATPLPVPPGSQKAAAESDSESDNDNNDESESDSETQAHRRNPRNDVLNQNLRILACDLLYVRELASAVHDGDFGRCEDIFLDLARIFRGGGSFNYSNEILHYIYNVKRVWSPEYA